jgi:hypothetical protein
MRRIPKVWPSAKEPESLPSFLHRRDSMSLMSLSTSEIAKRVKLGLVTDADEESSEDEEWDDFESSEEEADAGEDPRYTFSKNRRSSINLLQMNENYHDSSTNWDASQTSEPAGSGRGAMFDSGDMDAYSTGGSCRNLEGIAKETIKESDSEASTVNGEDSA